MIKSFKTRETEKIFSRQRSAQIPEEVQRIALRHLRALDHAETPQNDWLPTVNGSGPERYSIVLSERWRIGFEWREGQIYNVEIIDHIADDARGHRPR